MQVSSSQEQPQYPKLMTSQRDLPAEELAQPREQDASSIAALPATSLTLYQPTAELTQQVTAEQLPDYITPAMQQKAGAAVAVAATTSVVEMAAEHSALLATPTIVQAAREKDSPQAGAQLAGDTPLYTCHLQGLGEAPLDMFSQEDSPSAGRQFPFTYSRHYSRYWG